MAADTKGSNGFHRLQTFEQNLLARAYGILQFLLKLPMKFWRVCGCRNHWNSLIREHFKPSSRIYWTGPMEFVDVFLGFKKSEDTVAAEAKKKVMDSTTFRPSNKMYWSEPMGFFDLFLGFTWNYDESVVAETNGSNRFYRLQTFEQNLLARAYGILVSFLGFK